jgi:hypothetical protein
MSRILEINNLEEFMNVVRAKMQNRALVMIPFLLRCEELYASVNRGCACTKKNRMQHAEAFFRKSIIELCLRDKSDLLSLLGVGEDHDEVIIKSGGAILLTMKK